MSLANSLSVPFLAVFMTRQLGLSPATAGFIIGSSVFFSILAGVVGGSLSDILGPTRMLVLALFGVACSFTGFYFSHRAVAVFAVNATLALCTSSFNPVVKALLGSLVPQQDRVRWFSYQYVAVNVGFAVGPMLGGLTGLSGGRVAFLIGALIYLCYLGLLAGTLLLHPLPVDVPRSRPADRATRLSAVLSQLGESIRALALDRLLLGLIVGGLLMEAVHSRISALLAVDLSIGYHDGAKILGYVLTTNAVTVVAVQLLASRYVRKRDPVRSVLVGGVLLILGMVGFAAAMQPWHFVVAMAVLSVGETFIVPAEFALIDRLAPEDRRGSYFGAQTLAQLGGFLGPFTGSLLITWYGGRVMFLAVAGYGVAGMLTYLLVGRRLRSPVEAERGAEQASETS